MKSPAGSAADSSAATSERSAMADKIPVCVAPRERGATNETSGNPRQPPLTGQPMASLFGAVELAPRDPILGLNEQFNADPNPAKVNLGVGVYFDDNGKLPLLACVKAAEELMMEAPKARNYLPIDGIAAYDSAVQDLVFGADTPIRKSGRVATVQALGGT